jgi:transcriptional regulator with XRE-family HTH domain
MATNLPGIDTARDVLGLSFEEIADAVNANPSTLYRWRTGEATPNQASMERLNRLEELSAEIRRSLERAQTEFWLDAPVSVFDGLSPREMILCGRAETVLGALLSHRQLFRALRAADQGRTGFSDLLARDDLSLSTKAALALVDRQIDELMVEMQTEASSRAAEEAFKARPRVKLAAQKIPDSAARDS